MPPKAAEKAKAKPEKKDSKTDEQDGEKLTPPDKKAYDAELDKIQQAIEGFQNRQKELTNIISERSSGKDEYLAERATLKSQLDQLKAKIGELEEKRDEVNNQIQAGKESGRKARSDLERLQKQNGFTNEADIDERIAQIEFRMTTGSLSLNEEKLLLREICELKKIRPQVTRVKQKAADLSQMDFGGAESRESMELVREQLNQFRDARKKVSEQLQKLNEDRQGQIGDLKGIMEERNELSKKIQEQIAERNKIRDDFRAQDRAFQLAKREAAEARYAVEMQLRAAKDVERRKQQLQREAEKLDLNPYQDMMTLIEQTLTYCKTLAGPEDDGQKTEKKEVQHDISDGMQILARKEDREEVFFYVPTAKKKSKALKKKETDASKIIKHNAMSFTLFDQIGVNAPLNVGDVPAMIEDLNARLAEYEEKTKAWADTREENKRKLLAESASAEAAAETEAEA